MPTLKTPLVGSYNQRDGVVATGRDQKFKNAILQKIINNSTNTATFYLEKRAGLANSSPASLPGDVTIPTVLVSPLSLISTILFVWAQGATNSTIYAADAGRVAGRTQGAITGVAMTMIEVVLGSITYFMITSSDQTAWFLASDAINTGSALTFTGDTHTNTLIDNISSMTGIYVGQAVSGTNIPANARVATIAGASSITLTLATTGTTSGITVTRVPIAKIISANFPTNIVGGFEELDGYILIATSSSRLYNSDLNSVPAWSASNFITATISGDFTSGIIKHRNQIAVFGDKSIEYFYNAGNPSGSPLNSSPQLFSNIGCDYYYPVSSELYRNGLFARGDDSIYFLGADKNLYVINSFAPQKIDDKGILFSGSTSPRIMHAFTLFKSLYIHIGFLGAGDTIYSVDGKMDFEWALPGEMHMFQRGGVPYCMVDDSTGRIYQISNGVGQTAAWRDNGNAYTMSIQIQTDMGTNDRKWPTELRVNADTQSSGNLAVSYSDDDGATFSTARNIPLTSQRKRLNRLGSFCGRRLWKFEDSGNNANRIQSVEIDYDLGSQ